jgi:tRNA-Thr(GGU) m(6)t(6)A37 methyltransferase TsaA
MQSLADLRSIGTITAPNGRFQLNIHPEYTPALLHLSDFSHALILWWADQAVTEQDRSTLQFPAPYAKANHEIGTFASRSPARPNPIGLSLVSLLNVDEQSGLITIPYIDAEPGTPLLDIKPYFPASDKVEQSNGPDWCKHWPQSYEASADFNWTAEFT